jgi:alpha-D-xyloside xylohydrolase
MAEELKGMGVELMVSIWPTVDYRSENFAEMRRLGCLIRTERGIRVSMDFMGNSLHYDATKPEARQYVWEKVKKNYYDKGIRAFWLDEAEPEYTAYDFDNYRYHLGSDLAIGNIYPFMYSKTFYDGMSAAGQGSVINLIRCARAGSQRFGSLVWSGDIATSWRSLMRQVAAGLGMGLAGIPWWTTDIGGFHGGDPGDLEFRELFARGFEYGTFCPVMRLHGDREPHPIPVDASGRTPCFTGRGQRDLELRRGGLWHLQGAHSAPRAHEAQDRLGHAHRARAGNAPHAAALPRLPGGPEGMGGRGRVPVLRPPRRPGAPSRLALAGSLPAPGEWRDLYDGSVLDGGGAVERDAPIGRLPVFERLSR